MDLIDDAKAAATMAVPGPGAPDDLRAAFDAMPLPQLAERWRLLQFVGIKEQTEETWAASRYFDELPHGSPARTYDMVLAVLATETDRSVRLQLANNVMPALIHDHGATLVDRIEADAAANGALRWLMGGAYFWTQDQAIQQRLEAVADTELFRTDLEAHKSRNAPIAFDALSLDALSRAWIEQTAKPFKDHDDNWSALQDYQGDLIEHDPGRAIDLVIAVLNLEANGFLLSVLAAGVLEDVIDHRVIDRIEREATADPRFLALLGGVWYSRKPDDVKVRLDTILGRSPPP